MATLEYLTSQAERCLRRAQQCTDPKVVEALTRMAADFHERAHESVRPIRR